MEAARKLNTIGVLDEILVTLLDATLKLTRAERGYIFLRDRRRHADARRRAQLERRAAARRQDHFAIGA
jgi:GAF domain-containing protein